MSTHFCAVLILLKAFIKSFLIPLDKLTLISYNANEH